MNKISIASLTVFATLFSAGAFAQDTADTVQRNINQQQRIEEGLQSGALNTKEAARLERQEAAVEHMQARALRDGSLSEAEAQRLDRAQDKVSRDIYREKHDAQLGNPDSASSRRMQANVQRNINQQQRIQQGVQSGELSDREVGRLERGQSRVNRAEARAGADGHVGAAAERRVMARETRQSRHIYRQKHDRQGR